MRLSLLGVLLAGALLAAACSDESTTSTPTPEPSQQATASASATADLAGPPPAISFRDIKKADEAAFPANTSMIVVDSSAAKYGTITAVRLVARGADGAATEKVLVAKPAEGSIITGAAADATGKVIAATIFDGTKTSVSRSTDGGATFTEAAKLDGKWTARVVAGETVVISNSQAEFKLEPGDKAIAIPATADWTVPVRFKNALNFSAKDSARLVDANGVSGFMADIRNLPAKRLVDVVAFANGQDLAVRWVSAAEGGDAGIGAYSSLGVQKWDPLRPGDFEIVLGGPIDDTTFAVTGANFPNSQPALLNLEDGTFAVISDPAFDPAKHGPSQQVIAVKSGS